MTNSAYAAISLDKTPFFNDYMLDPFNISTQQIEAAHDPQFTCQVYNKVSFCVLASFVSSKNLMEGAVIGVQSPTA